MPGCNHVGLEQGALQVDVVVGQGLVNSGQDLLSDVLAAFQVVVTIRKNLRLNDGDDAVLRKAGTNVKMTIQTNTDSCESKEERTAEGTYCLCYLLVL